MTFNNLEKNELPANTRKLLNLVEKPRPQNYEKIRSRFSKQTYEITERSKNRYTLTNCLIDHNKHFEMKNESVVHSKKNLMDKMLYIKGRYGALSCNNSKI